MSSTSTHLTEDEFSTRLTESKHKVALRHKLIDRFAELTGIDLPYLKQYTHLIRHCQTFADIEDVLQSHPELRI